MIRPIRALLLVLLAATVSCTTPTGAEAQAGPTTIHFLDVGQGDAVLIRAADGRAVLYDSGERSIVEQLRALDVRSLELVIVSHNHADHMGSVGEILTAFKPRFLMENGVPNTTRAFERMMQAARDAGTQILAPTSRTITLGDARLHVIPPPGRASFGTGHNDNSIGIIVEIGSFRASLLGDAEHHLQDWWLQNHRASFRKVDVHKASHHGSRNGDTQAMMQVLSPTHVVISLGAGNTYGHPHAQALSLYQKATVHRTDQHGSVVVTVQPNGSYTVGRTRGDGQQATSTSSTAQSTTRTCIDLNRASPAELQRITHIDAERAGQIIRLRAARRFNSVADITRVNGIGAARQRDIVQQGLACVR
jgi:competence protein ComEC